MPEVSTDDAARNLRYPWKGPASAPFGFEVRFTTVGVFLVLTVLGWVGVGLLTPTFRLGLLLAALWVFAAAIITRRLVRHIDADRPLGYYVEIARAEFRTPRPHPIYNRKHQR